jgi:hypothetical protein
MLMCAALCVSACAAPGGSQNSALQAEVRQSVSQSRARQQAASVVLPAVLGLPLGPGHALAPDCVKDAARAACVILGGGREGVDAYTARAAYITVLEAHGWQMQWPQDEGAALLRTTASRQRCLKISFSLWDDGKSAKITLKQTLRFELDPAEIDCTNPGEGPPVITGIPGHRG